MRLWDLRVPHCQGLLEVPSGIPTAAYDLQVGMHQCCQPNHTKESYGRQKKDPTQSYRVHSGRPTLTPAIKAAQWHNCSVHSHDRQDGHQPYLCLGPCLLRGPGLRDHQALRRAVIR